MKNQFKVCNKCFNDEELIGFITSFQQEGTCDFCKQKDSMVINLVELQAFFQELIICFSSHESGQPLIDIIQNNWNFFKNKEVGEHILNQILSVTNSNIKNASESVSFNSVIQENVDYWEILKEELKWEKRYITNIEKITEGEFGWDSFFGSQKEITHKDILYRARLHNKADLQNYSEDEMYSPPKQMATAGRANPIGIPFLYLCDNKETTLYEIRATFLDEVSIGSFSLKEDINEIILISDFTVPPNLYDPGNVDIAIKSTLLKQKISKDLSKPLRRYDSEIDYIPTQFICEFIKAYTDVKGIKFKSSLHDMGNNLVIFDHDIMKCTKVEKYRINKVLISSDFMHINN